MVLKKQEFNCLEKRKERLSGLVDIVTAAVEGAIQKTWTLIAGMLARC